MESIWNILSAGSFKRSKSNNSFETISPNLFITREATQEVLKLLRKSDPESRSYKELHTALINLTHIFAADDYAICVIYFLKNNGLVTLGAKLGELPTSIINLVFNLLKTLIRNVCGRDEALAKDKDMVLGITSVLQSLLNHPIVNGSLEQSLADFLFYLASIMRHTPRLLVSWFEIIEAFYGAPALQKNEEPVDSMNEQEKHNTVTKTDLEKQVKTVEIQYHREFPMFYLLLEYIHHEGNVGEVARTALLYLMEVASKYKPITRWVIDSDLGGFMASGLGALYSQLCRAMSKESVMNYLGNGAFKSNSDEAVINSNKELKVFLSYLLFWQRIMEFCEDIDCLADHFVYNFDALFVRQLLYPSVIESTDLDGGYSDVLIEILATILNYLQNNILSELIVCYFMGQVIENNPIILARLKKCRPGTSESSNSSLSSNSIHQKPLITLFDIISTTLDSSNTNKRACTLKLLAILIAKYYPYVINKLIPTTGMITLIDDKGNFSKYPVSIQAEEELFGIQNMMNEVKLDFQRLFESENSNVEILNLNDYLPENIKGSKVSNNLLNLFGHFSLDPNVVSDYQSEVTNICHLQMNKFSSSENCFVQFKTESLNIHRITSDKNKILSKSECHSRGSDNDFDYRPLVIQKKNIIEQVISDRLKNYFENSFAENLALTQVIIRLGAWGYVDLRGWVFDELVSNIKFLTKTLVNSKLNEMKEAARKACGDEDKKHDEINEIEFAPNKILGNEILGTTKYVLQNTESVEGLYVSPSISLHCDNDARSGTYFTDAEVKKNINELTAFDNTVSVEKLCSANDDKILESVESYVNSLESQDDQSLKGLTASESHPSPSVPSATSTLIKPVDHDDQNSKSPGLGRWAFEISTLSFKDSKKFIVESLNFLSLSSSSSSKYDVIQKREEISVETKNNGIADGLDIEKQLIERSFYEFLHELNALFYVRSRLFGEKKN